MEILVLSEIDVAENEIWLKSLRSIVCTAGLENKNTLLFIALGSQDCENFLRVLSNVLSHGLDPLLFEKDEIFAIERKRKTEGDIIITYREICLNIIKNIHVVFSMNLNDPLTTIYFSKFTSLISKFVIKRKTSKFTTTQPLLVSHSRLVAFHLKIPPGKNTNCFFSQ